MKLTSGGKFLEILKARKSKMKYYYSEHDETVASLDTQIEKLTKRYVAKALTKCEDSPTHLHNKIIKKHFYWLKDDILKLIAQ